MMLKADGRVLIIRDEITTLFLAFLVVRYKVFCYYMERNKEKYEESHSSNLPINKLILFAQNKYTNHTEASNNVWGTVSRQNLEVVTLKYDMINTGVVLKLAPKIPKKHITGITNNNRSGNLPDNPISNTLQAKK